MFFKAKPFFYALLFFLGMEVVDFWRGFDSWILGGIILSSVWAGRRLGKRWIFSIFPAIFSFSSILLFYLITPFFGRQTFIFLSFFLYYLLLLGVLRLGKYPRDKTAQGMIGAALSSSVFFAYSGIYGFYLNFQVPLYFLVFSYGAVAFLASFFYFKVFFGEEEKAGLVPVYSLLLGLVMAELAWTVNFWPFGYLTTGVVSLMAHYVLWDLTQSYFSGMLSRRRVAANIIFFSAMTAFILATSKWLPVS